MKILFRKLSGISLSDKVLQLSSIVLAVICWYGIQSVNDSDSTVYRSADPALTELGRTLSSILPIGIVVPTGERAVKVRVEPKMAKLKFDRDHLPLNEGQEKISIFVDCSNITSGGEYRLPLNCIAPSDSTVVDIQPSSVIVKVEFID